MKTSPSRIEDHPLTGKWDGSYPGVPWPFLTMAGRK